ncbi:GAF domain-containing protein [Gorillibacterium sp. CAU 1737]|uniref:GAF domain-containing protein n=1 Tax=Gorillibacterium sp. CAU 1737 TaxID=3140362 RepID=UPI003261561E
MDETGIQVELNELRLTLGYDLLALALVEPAEHHYVIKWKFLSGNLGERIRKVVLQSGRGVPGIVFKTGKPFLISSVPDLILAEDLFQYPIIKLEELTSLVAVPVWHEGRVEGILLGAYRDERRVDERSLAELQERVRFGLMDLNGKEMMPN